MGNSKPTKPWPRKPSRPQKRAVDRTVKPWSLRQTAAVDPKTTRPKFSFQKRKSTDCVAARLRLPKAHRG
eukprot:TRINITY_DN8242_c0_g1_i1.p1 TRINITY_DN8242_c0_g1~~TRINITY_DN8242_c0_g1_i1.p1  ORF type:complete len:70 (+),score=23.34 TRINITY_DN8242_c0_g1_i1:34-243(+)